MLSKIWKYFDRNNNAAFTKPVKPVILIDKLFFFKKKLFQIQNAQVIKN